MDTLNCLKEKKKKGKKEVDQRFQNASIGYDKKKKKIKTMIDFDKRESNSIKSIVVNSSTTVDVSTRSC